MASTLEERHSLLSDNSVAGANNANAYYGSAPAAAAAEDPDNSHNNRQHIHANLMKRLAHGDRTPSILPTTATAGTVGAADAEGGGGSPQQVGNRTGPVRFLYYIVYALV